MGLDWTVDSEQLDYKSTAGAVLITYKQIVCLRGGHGCSSVQCEDRSVEFSLEQAMNFTIDQMARRVCKIEHLVERAQRQLEASD